jgi:ParB family chromosome partitioning protein
VPLGKSLDNILDDYFGQNSVTLNNDSALTDGSAHNVREIPLEQIKLSPYQTRNSFEPEKIQSLAKNISEQGLIQPVVVIQKKVTSSTTAEFILLAGERRLRAVKSLGWKTILAVVRPEESLTESQQAMLSAMENLQREDLNPIELAQTFRMLMLTQQISEEELSTLLGNSVQYVKNYLRLLGLSKSVKQALIDNLIGEGQARNLVPLETNEQDEILALILAKHLTVKEIVALIATRKQLRPLVKIKTIGHRLPQDVIQRADRLASTFPNASLKCSGDINSGKIVISWKNQD